ncbi:hypothetical protein IJ380_02215 [Candidatus Saccharibacteria bacterium]|nr:hypothetical protein [Candidatus Saccharibacteria bacterium]
MPELSPLDSFLKKYQLPLFLGTFILILLVIAVIFTTITGSPDYGVDSDDSKIFDASIKADEEILKEKFGIYKFFPIESLDPSFKLGYDLSFNEKTGNYEFCLVIDAFSASAREDAVKTLLSSDFGEYDALDYEIFLKNYVNPLASLELSSLLENLPENFSISGSKDFEDGVSVKLLSHSLYDGSKNTYRAVFKNEKLLSTPKLVYSYSDLPELPHALIKEINSI